MTTWLTAAIFALALSACSSGGSSGGESGDGDDASSFSLRITDAPFNDAVSVNVKFIAVHLKRASGDTVHHNLASPMSIDLSSLQGTTTAELVADWSVPPGDYQEIRLLVDDSNPMNNTIEFNGGLVFPLMIPSGGTSGLKLKGNFTLSMGRETTLIADIDLLQSIVMAGKSGKYILKPVVRLVDSSGSNHLRGTLDPALLAAPSCSDMDPTSHNAIYVYEGFTSDIEDIDQSGNAEDQPLTTASVELDPVSGDFVYEVGFLPAGKYTIAFTCNANLEDLDDDDDLSFFNVQNVEVLINDVLFL